MIKPELLAPAGSLEKLKMAVLYGADAVYVGGREFSLRSAAENFSEDELKEGIEFAHSRGVKVYVALNIIPHNEDLERIPAFAKTVYDMGADALIVADLGIFSMVRELLPDFELHISTQANNVNYQTIKMWHKMGAKRVVLARELSFEEIKHVRENTPNTLDLEAFIHGAMCVSYSGRCLLSNYLTDRDGNKGECAQPCRWKYYLVEEKRPGEYIPIAEDDRGSFIFNSKDLCMIEYIPQLIAAGISSFKIEGRVKSSYYVATVVKAYREAIDSYCDNPKDYVFNPEWKRELEKVSHRAYGTGFFFGKPDREGQVYNTSSYIREYDIVGMVQSYDPNTQIAKIEQRNRFYKGEEIEIIQPKMPYFSQRVEILKDERGNDIDVAPHPQMILYINMDRPVEKDAIIRKVK